MTAPGDTPIIVGRKYRSKEGAEFVVTRDHWMLVHGVLTAPGRPAEEGGFPWGVFQDQFDLVEDGETDG